MTTQTTGRAVGEQSAAKEERAGVAPPCSPARSSLSMLADAIDALVDVVRESNASAPASDLDSWPGRDLT